MRRRNGGLRISLVAVPLFFVGQSHAVLKISSYYSVGNRGVEQYKRLTNGQEERGEHDRFV